MSTNIDGYKFTRALTFQQLNTCLVNFKKLVLSNTARLATTEAAQIAADLVDHRTIGIVDENFKRPETTPARIAIGHVLHSYMKYYDSVTPDAIEFDFELGITVYQVTKYCGHQPFLATLSGHPEHKSLFEKHADVIDYHYQDMADRPPEVSSRQWKQRLRDWSAVFEPSWTPAIAGYTTNCVGKYGLPTINDYNMLNVLPKFKKRVEEHAKAHVLEMAMTNGATFDKFTKAIVHLGTNEGKKELAKAHNKIAKVLLSDEDLRKAIMNDLTKIKTKIKRR